MTAERAKSKIGRWVDETMKGKFDNFVGSRKKSSSSNTATKINNDIPIVPDADENIDADLLYSVKPAELHSRTTESTYEEETTRPPINLADIDLGLLFSNMTRKHHLEDVDADERDVGRMIQRHLKLLNIGTVGEDEH
ncbi:uncharacterized protein LOC100572022 isoform X1 [Acyrthosiphon pisum]|uniref:Uncharacterized protein n=2 Tax=Acyrthosiphon pisum TaxID=7029 RepID=A0A8R1W777_ACYPI|nr:uncharacterized protein LOC100572022 isoform X1 [Acyrthosiphon pisum]|eukprot:XP_003248214.1 PREDICTED: uncharacterized protein LOC100572022 isoform X1 [Acyrthosiphon pisum]